MQGNGTTYFKGISSSEILNSKFPNSLSADNQQLIFH